MKPFAIAMDTTWSPGTIASPRVLGCLMCPRGLDSMSAAEMEKI